MLVFMNINTILVQGWKLYEKVFGDFDVTGKGLNEAIRCWASTYPPKKSFFNVYISFEDLGKKHP